MNNEINLLRQEVGLPVPNWTPPELPRHELMEGRLCRLEPLNASAHAAALHSANQTDSEGSMWTYLPYGPFDTLDTYRMWVAEVSQGYDPQFYAIVDNATGRATGVASYLRIDPRNGSIEVGHINYSPLLRRTPAATEAMYLMMQRAFKLGYRRYEWKCDALNAPSRAAALRLGFSFEGIFRQATVVKGRNRDTAWYSVIDKEWPELRAVFLKWLDPSNFEAEGKQRTPLSSLTARRHLA